jgi:hypothetical protein
MIEEIPKTDFILISYTQLIILVIQLHSLAALSLELEQKFFGYEVVFIDGAVHRKQKEIAVALAG